jgi:hypothetical protein
MEASPVIQTGPVTSIVCSPENGTRIGAGVGGEIDYIDVSGIAWAGGGCHPSFADVSSSFVPAYLR